MAQPHVAPDPTSVAVPVRRTAAGRSRSRPYASIPTASVSTRTASPSNSRSWRPRSAWAAGSGALRNQLDLASVSIVLNIAEGTGRFTPAEKAHFYLIARGSAMECVAAISLLHARSLVSPQVHGRSRALLTRIVAMLTRLAIAMQRRGESDRRSQGLRNRECCGHAQNAPDG